MTYSEIITPFLTRIMNALPSLLFGVLILVVGYLAARLGTSLVGRTVRKTTLDRRVADLLGLQPPTGQQAVEATVRQITFWVIMLFVLIGFFSQVGLPLVAEPLRAMIEKVTTAAPNIFEAVVILAVAWILGALLRALVVQAATRTDLEGWLRRHLHLEATELAGLPERLGTLVFYLILLIALPALLSALGQSAIVEPLLEMFRTAAGYLPNVVGAALTVAVGWVVARILREVVRNLLSGTGIDQTVERMGLPTVTGDVRLSGLVGSIVYFVVWIPFIVAGLDALKIEAVSVPAVTALNTILSWIPKGLAAAAIVFLAYVVSRFLGNLVAQFFRGIGFDTLPARLGLTSAPEAVGGRSLSDIAGVVVTALILLFASIEALQVMGLTELAQFGETLARFAVDVFLAAVIVGIGFWVAAYVQGLIQEGLERAGSPQARLLGLVGRYAVVIFAFAMGLQQIGLGEHIVVTAFTLIIGAICLALALAFGLGARETAGRAVQRFLERDEPKDVR